MALNPPLETVQSIKDAILHILQNHALPASLRATCIAPQLTIVNQWSDQLLLVPGQTDVHTAIDLVFAIRKDLYTAPQFAQCVLGIPVSELPPAFTAFSSMIHKLIRAQKPDKEKPIVKPKRIPRIKSKVQVDSDGEVEISLPTVSDTSLSVPSNSNDSAMVIDDETPNGSSASPETSKKGKSPGKKTPEKRPEVRLLDYSDVPGIVFQAKHKFLQKAPASFAKCVKLEHPAPDTAANSPTRHMHDFKGCSDDALTLAGAVAHAPPIDPSRSALQAHVADLEADLRNVDFRLQNFFHQRTVIAGILEDAVSRLSTDYV